eukprot:16446711-Heterocapsa_arctica.AAC.1
MCAPPPRFELDEWAAILAKDGGAGGMKTSEIWCGESAELHAFWRLQELAHGFRSVATHDSLNDVDCSRLALPDFLGILHYLTKKKKCSAAPPWRVPRDLWAVALLGNSNLGPGVGSPLLRQALMRLCF